MNPVMISESRQEKSAGTSPGPGRTWLGVAAAFMVAMGLTTQAMDNPFSGIVARNMFNLVPMPTNNPADANKQPDPPAKISANGIMTLFGAPEVLFQVTLPPKPNQPQQVNSYTMSEGDRQDGIEVVKIDQAAGIITFNNNGVVQEIPLGAATSSGPASGPASSPANAFGRPAWSRGPGGPGMPGFQGYAAGSSPGYSANPSSPMDNNNPNAANGGMPNVSPTSMEGSQARLNSMLNDPNYLTPEAQTVLIEANRQQLQAAGDPTAALLPPTDITPQDPNGGTGPGVP